MTVIIVASFGLLSWQSLGIFESSLTPELDKKAQVIGKNVVADIERAVGLGIPFSELNGVDAYLTQVKNTYPEIKYAAVTDAAGRSLFKSNELDAKTTAFFRSVEALNTTAVSEDGKSIEIDAAHDLALPLPHSSKAIGMLHIGIDKKFVQRQLNDIFFDLAIILIVGLLVAVEIALALVTFYVTAPLERLGRVLALYSGGNFSQVLIHKSKDAVGSVAGFLEDCARRQSQLCPLSGRGFAQGEAREKHPLRDQYERSEFRGRRSDRCPDRERGPHRHQFLQGDYAEREARQVHRKITPVPV